MSRLPFELFLALRYLRPKRTFVSVITLISVLGVMLGVAVLIIVISVMSGFDRQMQDSILGFHSHMHVFERNQGTGRTGLMRNWWEAVEKVRQVPEVRGAAPFIVGKVMVETQPERGESMIEAPVVRGVDPEFEPDVSVLTDKVVMGEANLAGRSMLVGIELAGMLNLRVGDRLAVYSHRALKRMRESQGNEVIPPDDYEITGIFDVGNYDYNYNYVVTSLYNAQDLYDLEDQVHGLMVMVDDPFRVDQVRLQIYENLGAGFRINTWKEENKEILDALQVEKSVMFYILFFIMIVAAFGIMNSLITFVVQKTRDIGMLKALGATRGQIVWLFMSQSLIVGVIGVTLGFGFGMLALHYRNDFLAVMRGLTGMELFPAEIYFFTELPALIVAGDIVLICGSALVISVLAGVIPAFTAARLRPVQALRNE